MSFYSPTILCKSSLVKSLMQDSTMPTPEVIVLKCCNAPVESRTKFHKLSIKYNSRIALPTDHVTWLTENDSNI